MIDLLRNRRSMQSCGLRSCWIQIRNRLTAKDTTSEVFIRETLGVPEHLRVESIIALGRPAEKKRPVPAAKLNFRKISLARYGSKG